MRVCLRGVEYFFFRQGGKAVFSTGFTRKRHFQRGLRISKSPFSKGVSARNKQKKNLNTFIIVEEAEAAG